MTENSTAASWEQCPVGLLDRMISRIRVRRRLRVASRMGGYAAVFLIAGITLVRLWVRDQPSTSTSEYNFGGISCARVLGLAGAYLNGRVDDELSARIREHVAACPHCRPIVEKMLRDRQLSQRVTPQFSERSADALGVFEAFNWPPRREGTARRGLLDFARHAT